MTKNRQFYYKLGFTHIKANSKKYDLMFLELSSNNFI